MKFSTLTIVSALALGVTAEHIPVHFGKRHNFAARDQLSDTVANIQNNLTSGADNEDINNIQDLISKYQQSQEGKRDDQSAPVNDAVLNQTQSSNGSNCNLAQTIQQLFQNFQQLQAGNNRRDDVFGGIENFLKNMRRDDKLSEITQFLSEHQDEIQPLIQKLNQTQSSNKSQSSNEDNCDFAQAIQQLLQNFQQSQQAFAAVTRDVSNITSDRPIKHFTLNVTEVFDTLNGDENNKRILYAINGTPFNGGEALRVNEGDRVIIDLLNNAYSMNTTLHGHGIPQDGTPWSDGVPGITQSLVEPGQNFTYDFFAENISNAYWLHSHMSDLYQDGIALPIYITPSDDRKRPFSLIPNITEDEVEALKEMDKNPEIMMVSDYSVLNATQQISESKYWHSELLCYDSILINGRGRINCPSMHSLETYADANPNALISSDIITAKGCPNINANAVSENATLEDNIWFDCNQTKEPLQTFEFDYESGWGVLYMVSAASHWTYIVSIDEHPVYIFNADGTYHEPAQAEAFSFVIGERLGLAFRLHTPGEYTMRISVLNAPQILGTYAIIRYGLADDDFSIIYTDPINEGEPGLPMIPASVPYINYGGGVTNDSIQIFESAQLKSFDAPPVPKAHEKADVTLRFDLGYDGVILWSMTYNNDTTEYYPESRQYEEPPVLFDMEKYINATSTVSYPSGSVVDIIFAVVGTVQPPHPMHKHFSHAHILSYGNGNWTYDNTDITKAEQQGIEINWENPPFTDTFNTPESTATEGSYMVIRYQSTQPATELIHCHIWSHQGMGMSYLLVSEGETEIPEYYKRKSLASIDSA